MSINIYGNIFSRVYDKYWTEYIDDLAPGLIKFCDVNIKSKKILDLCCGTGRLANIFLKNNYDVIGLDQSENMLRIARYKNNEFNNFRTIHADARDFNINGLGLVISTFDSLNHFLNTDELNKIFSSVFDSLIKDAYFIFDLNTLRNLKEWDFIDIDETDDLMIVMYGKYSNQQKRAFTKVIGFYSEDKQCYNRFEEVMYNTVFSIEDINKLLIKVGFKNVKYYDPNNLSANIPDPEKLDRVMIVCQKL